MKRREFLVAGAETMALALASRSAASILQSQGAPASLQSQESSDALEQRLVGIVQAYDAQGNHRTGTAVDRASAEWLASEIRQRGLESVLEPFPLSRVDPQSCYLRIAGRRIDGVPLFDASFTDGEGVRGKLGPLGSDAEIGLAESQGSKLIEAASPQFRQSRHKAVVLLSWAGRPGLFLLNAPLFRKPSGPPTLQISSAESEWLKEQAALRAEPTLVASVRRTPTPAFNVTTKIKGADSRLAPLVVMTPRSGSWQCASERGGGIACWLETMRVLAAGKPSRDCFFAATSAHEFGGFGIEPYLEHRKELIKRAHAFIHFGANIGASRQPNMIVATDESLEQWAVRAMEKEGMKVNRRATRGSRPGVELGPTHDGGGRYFALVCDNEFFFHNAGDRWPEAIDVMLLARYARAFSTAALELAGQRTPVAGATATARLSRATESA
jgi:hypothetical protein